MTITERFREGQQSELRQNFLANFGAYWDGSGRISYGVQLLDSRLKHGKGLLGHA